MQGITLLVVGETDSAQVQSLIQEYLKRANRFTPFVVETIPAIKLSKKDSKDKQKQLEGEAILRAIGPQDEPVLLDERGKEYSSREFATFLNKKMQTTPRRLMFIIGGAYGFSDEVYARAAGKISLSRMTMNHQLVRLFAVEQVYRALTILNNHPYHHD